MHNFAFMQISCLSLALMAWNFGHPMTLSPMWFSKRSGVPSFSSALQILQLGSSFGWLNKLWPPIVLAGLSSSFSLDFPFCSTSPSTQHWAQGLARPDFDHREDTKTENIWISMMRPRLKMSVSQWRVRDWKYLSLNYEIDTVTEKMWVSVTRPRLKMSESQWQNRDQD